MRNTTLAEDSYEVLRSYLRVAYGSFSPIAESLAGYVVDECIFKDVFSSVNAGRLVVVIAGTARTADILANALR